MLYALAAMNTVLAVCAVVSWRQTTRSAKAARAAAVLADEAYRRAEIAYRRLV